MFLSQNGDPTFFNAGNIDNNAGILSNVYGLIMGSPSTLEPESFASITMSVKEQATSTSTISLKNVIISDPSGNPIDFVIENTTLTINEVPVVTYNPYDKNKDGLIDFGDVSAGIDGYRNGLSSLAEISELIDLYLASEPYC